MRVCPTCKSTYPEDANFCPQETCATSTGPQRLQAAVAEVRSRFQIGPRIGGGNTGVVFRATDTQGGAEVAYKIVSSEVLPNATALARAEREFKQLMRVSSPRIATILDCGRSADDRLYVAMELCAGDSLVEVLRAGAMPLGRAKTIVQQIGQALLEAQKAGIVHRDVAPKNVLVAPSGDVKVINFPLAKPINDRASGVAAYLSPEQIQGKPVDQRSNTYSLAAVFYHLLTGEPPFQGTPETVLELHVGSPPLAPSQRRPEAALTPEVDRVVLKALDKSSSRRHLTLRLFLSEVEALVASPGEAQPAASKGAGGVGFARTMLFAGGQAEVANLVAKAIAARTGSPARGVQVSPAAQPAPAAAPSPAAVAARVPSPVSTLATGTSKPAVPSAPENAAQPLTESLAPHPPAAARLTGPSAADFPAAAPATNGSAAADEFSDRMARLTPPPMTPFPPLRAPVIQLSPAPAAAADVSAAPGTGAAQIGAAPTSRVAARAGAAPVETSPSAGAEKGKGSAFRETLWFKKGDVEHMIAEARAKMASQGKKEPEGEVEPAPELTVEESKPIEDRYLDDGTLTTEDHKKFSLRSGGIATATPAARRAAVPGAGMTERDVIREVSGARRVILFGLVGLLVAGILAAVFWLMRDRPALPPGSAPAARAVPAPAPPGVVAPAGMAAGRAASKPRPIEEPLPVARVDSKDTASPGPARASEKRSSRRRSERRNRVSR
jgi:hypothetical protein